MLGSFIIILFVLFGGSVGAVVFLHTQFGWQAVLEVLIQEMSRNLPTFRKENVLTYQFWNWLQQTFNCCGVEKDDGWKIWSTSDGLQSNWKVPESCCKEGEKDCMYEPSWETAYLEGCAPKVVLYVQILFYGIPIIMFVRYFKDNFSMIIYNPNDTALCLHLSSHHRSQPLRGEGRLLVSMPLLTEPTPSTVLELMMISSTTTPTPLPLTLTTCPTTLIMTKRWQHSQATITTHQLAQEYTVLATLETIQLVQCLLQMLMCLCCTRHLLGMI